MSVCLCTGACLQGTCSAYPNGRMGGCYGTYSSSTPPTFSEIQNFRNKINIDLESVRQQVNAQEHTINHTQVGIEKCFERIEKVEEIVDVEKIKSTIFHGAQTHASILKCEAALKKINYCLGDLLEQNQKIKIQKPDGLLPDGKIANPFEYIAVDAKRRDDMRHIQKTLYEFYCWVINTVEDNKERSKGIERLEEAAMWLNKSISRRKDDGKQNEVRNDR